VSGRLLRRNRYIGAGIDAGRTTLKHTGKVAHSLWLQITGFVFCAFAVIGAFACRRELARTGDWTHDTRFLVTLGFTLMFAYFGISAFARSRS
jgi:hypothetical protein